MVFHRSILVLRVRIYCKTPSWISLGLYRFASGGGQFISVCRPQ